MEATTEISKETKSMSATVSATTTTTSNNNTNNTEDDLKLKPEFVLSSTHPTLTPYVDPRSNRNNNNNDDNNKHEDENKKQSNHKQKENRHKKNKRELKKRSRENEDSFKVCKAVLMGKECPFGDNCKFNHNLKEVLNNREEDIKEIGSCPHFDRKG